jgi:hypothetical protein
MQQEWGKDDCIWLGNIKLDLREAGWGGMDWIHLAQARDQWKAVVSTAMNLLAP